MMKGNTRLRICLLLLLVTVSLAGMAQEKDFQLWKGLILEKSLMAGKLQLNLNEEVRLVNNASDVGKAFTDISAHYKFIKGLSIGGGYRYMVERDVNVHRLYSDLTWSPKMKGRLDFAFRARYQMDMTPLANEGVLRFRATASYNVKGTKVLPFLGVEPWIDMGGDVVTGYNQLRSTAGFTYPLRKKVELRVAYIMDYELGTLTPDQDHALYLRVTVDLDKKDEEKNDSQIGW